MGAQDAAALKEPREAGYDLSRAEDARAAHP